MKNFGWAGYERVIFVPRLSRNMFCRFYLKLENMLDIFLNETGEGIRLLHQKNAGSIVGRSFTEGKG